MELVIFVELTAASLLDRLRKGLTRPGDLPIAIASLVVCLVLRLGAYTVVLGLKFCAGRGILSRSCCICICIGSSGYVVCLPVSPRLGLNIVGMKIVEYNSNKEGTLVG